jgi:hypothetical protein
VRNRDGPAIGGLFLGSLPALIHQLAPVEAHSRRSSQRDGPIKFHSNSIVALSWGTSFEFHHWRNA